MRPGSQRVTSLATETAVDVRKAGADDVCHARFKTLALSKEAGDNSYHALYVSDDTSISIAQRGTQQAQTVQDSGI